MQKQYSNYFSTLLENILDKLKGRTFKLVNIFKQMAAECKVPSKAYFRKTLTILYTLVINELSSTMEILIKNDEDMITFVLMLVLT